MDKYDYQVCLNEPYDLNQMNCPLCNNIGLKIIQKEVPGYVECQGYVINYNDHCLKCLNCDAVGYIHNLSWEDYEQHKKDYYDSLAIKGTHSK